jgi:DNA-directed RNA polymerase alpha subunit
MNRADFNEDAWPHPGDASVPDPIAEMAKWAGGQDGLREDSNIVALGCSPRVTYALERAGIRTLSDLAEVTAADLMNVDGFDEESMVELEERLNAFKLRLATPQETLRGKLQAQSRAPDAERHEQERVERQAATRPPGYEPH